MNTFTAILLSAAFFGLFSAQGAFGQAEYKFNGETFKLMPFSTDVEAPGDASYMQEKSDERVDLSDEQTAVKYQGYRGSCSFYTFAGLIEHSIKKSNGGKEINVSEEYMIYYSKAVIGYNPTVDSSNFSVTQQAVREGGLLLEEDMPYTYSWFSKGMPCEDEDESTTQRVECFAHKAPTPKQSEKLIQPEEFVLTTDIWEPTYVPNDRIKWIMTKLQEGVPVSAAVQTARNGWNKDTGVATMTQEMFRNCIENPDQCGGHAVVLVGYDRSTNMFRFKNSWGTKWGENGYGTMSFEYIDWHSFRGVTTTTVVENFPQNVENTPTHAVLSDSAYEILPDQTRNGEEGILLKITYTLDAPLSTFYHVSFSSMIKDDEGEYQPIKYKNEAGKDRPVVDRFHKSVTKLEDLSRGDDNPLELFISYALLEKAGIKEGTKIFLKASIGNILDTESYKEIFKEFVPYTL